MLHDGHVEIPAVLSRLATETGGALFSVVINDNGTAGILHDDSIVVACRVSQPGLLRGLLLIVRA